MSYNYLVTAQKPTSATHSVTGHFTSSRDLNLIVAKGNRLEIYTVTPEGLVAVLDVGLYGTITCLQLFHPQNEQQDSLFVLTAKYHVAILSYDQSSGDIITRAYGDVKSRVGKPTEIRMIGIVDPDCKVIGIHIYSGLLKIIPLELDSGQELRATDIRLDDLFVVDLTFLHGYKTPTIAYIAEMKNTRHLKVYSLAMNEIELKQCGWQYSVEPFSNIIIPTPLSSGGCVIIGMETITYYNKNFHKSISLAKDHVIQCYGRVDSHRYLVGDTTGKMFMLYLQCEEKMSELVEEVVTDLKLQQLGEAAIGKSLSYLDNGVVFVASSFGDCQLVKLLTEPMDGSFIQLLDTYTGLGPILDMAAVDLTRQGYDQLITCSGAGKEGSLRVIRNGIGINELASIDLNNIKGVWAVRTGNDDDGSSFNNTLVLSFVGQTRILLLNDEEVEEAELDGFSDSEQTFFAGNVAYGQLVQVTMTTIRMIDADGLNLICEWKPPSGRNISTVACNREQIVVAIGRDVHYIEIGDRAFKEVSHVTMEHEVACIDITPLTDNKQCAELCALGLWTDISVRVLQLPTLDAIHCQLLGGEIIPRSVAMVQFEGISYLLVALGDGTLFYFNIDPLSGNITNQKRLVLGTKPVILRHFEVAGTKNIFACSDQPTIIYTSNHKLLFSNVNMKEVMYMCSLNSKQYPESLALINANSLTIGTVDEIQKLHIRTIPLFESPRRITFHSTTRTFGVVTVRHDLPVTVDGATQYAPARSSASTTAPSRSFSSGDVAMGNHRSMSMMVSSSGTAVEAYSVLLVDSVNFEVLHAHQLKPIECSLSIASCELGGEEYIVVGTGVANHENYESTLGRLIVMNCSNGKLEVCNETEVPGCVYCIVPFNGRLVAAINNRVSVYRWTEDKELKEVATYTNNIMALFLKVKGDFILVGDLLRSFSLLVFKQDKKDELSLIAMDTNLNPAMMMAIEIIDDDTFLGADSQHIFICQKNSDATTEEDMRYMIQPAQVHVGDSVNVFRHGSLVMEHPGLSATPILGKPIIFGTVFGSIGMVCQLKDDAYRLLGSLQQSLLTVVNSVGNIEHSVWRSFSTEHRTRVSVGFIDGDLVERFLDLPRDKMELVVKNMKPTQPGAGQQDGQNSSSNLLDEIIKLVEDLSRLH